MKAYEEGWYGSKDMAESYALEAIEKLTTPTNEKNKKLIKDAEDYFKRQNEANREMAEQIGFAEEASLWGIGNQPPSDIIPERYVRVDTLRIEGGEPTDTLRIEGGPMGSQGIQWIESHPTGPSPETTNYGYVPDSITVNVEVPSPIDGVENIQIADAAPPNYGEQLIDQAAYEDHISSEMHQEIQEDQIDP